MGQPASPPSNNADCKSQTFVEWGKVFLLSPSALYLRVMVGGLNEMTVCYCRWCAPTVVYETEGRPVGMLNIKEFMAVFVDPITEELKQKARESYNMV